MHPQAIAEGVARSSKVFFTIRLTAAVVVLSFIIQRLYDGRMIKVLLYLAVTLVFMHDFPVIIESPYY
jgi:hypothetical protein